MITSIRSGGLPVSLQVNGEGLIAKLKAANDLLLTVLVPAQNRGDIDQHRGKAPWLQAMLDAGRIFFVVDVLDVLELALDGRYMGGIRLRGPTFFLSGNPINLFGAMIQVCSPSAILLSRTS